jgi:hypothetical protein
MHSSARDAVVAGNGATELSEGTTQTSGQTISLELETLVYLKGVSKCVKYVTRHFWKAKPNNQANKCTNDASRKDVVNTHPD